MHASPDKESKVVARLEPGVVVAAIDLQSNWCKVEIKSSEGRYKGWILRQNLWGMYPDEIKFK
jgi:SH3-like domain-containing protein